MSTYCDDESFKQYIYFEKCIYMSIMCEVITENQNCFFSVDDGGVSDAQVDGKRVTQLRSSAKTWYMNNVKALISLPHYMDDKPTF